VAFVSGQAGVNVPVVRDSLYEIAPFTTPFSTHPFCGDANEVVAVARPLTIRRKVCSLKIDRMLPASVRVAETTEFTGTSIAPSTGIVVTFVSTGGVPSTMVTDTEAVRVTPPEA